METGIYQDIATRTGGDIYVGVVGPVRTGKSTFIKRFMESLVIPHMENVYVKERARDELPQSGSGRTIMTAEPKFVPEEAARVTLEDGASFSLRMIDCVGYMVPGAMGQMEGETERMVHTPWFPEEIPMADAAEHGTRKVIQEHSTIGIVITTDGSVTELPREAYLAAEEKVITELQTLGKPFTVVVNTQNPGGEQAQNVCRYLSEKYGVSCLAEDCMTLDEKQITAILQQVLYEFPVGTVELCLPSWVDALPVEHTIRQQFLSAVRTCAPGLCRISHVRPMLQQLGEQEIVSDWKLTEMNLGTGHVQAEFSMPRALFYETVSDASGFAVKDDGDLMTLMEQFSSVKGEYDRVRQALEDVRTKGYGIVMPSKEEMELREPEIVKQGGRYGVRLKASAPSIHMMMANVETEVYPAVGGEKSSEEIINFLLQEFEGDVSKIWQSNIFGKSLYDIAGEGLHAKIKKLPEDTREKVRQALQRMINDGSGGMICILL